MHNAVTFKLIYYDYINVMLKASKWFRILWSFFFFFYFHYFFIDDAIFACHCHHSNKLWCGSKVIYTRRKLTFDFYWIYLTLDTTTLKAAPCPHVFAIIIAIGTELPEASAEFVAIFVSATYRENMHVSWNTGQAGSSLKRLYYTKYCLATLFRKIPSELRPRLWKRGFSSDNLCNGISWQRKSQWFVICFSLTLTLTWYNSLPKKKY